MPFDLYPSIDLRGGQVVRLHRGDFAAETVYGDDPVHVAHAFAAAGTQWIHVVDLDAARTGERVNLAVVEAICAAVPCRVQASGGVRTVEAGGDLLAAGAARVEGFNVSAKTGTAQVASTERVGKKNKDHAWLISFAPRDKPELSLVVLTENVGFGSTYSAPRAQAIYDDYYRRTRGLPPKAEETKAENSGPGGGARSPEARTRTVRPTSGRM